MLLSFGTTHSHPTSPAVEHNELNLQRARPIQQFFKKILNALSPTTTTQPPTSIATTKRTAQPSAWNTYVEVQEIPNFVDFSTFLLDSFSSENSVIKFTYMQPNASVASSLRGNYSVISFLVPHRNDKKEDKKTKGVFSFLSSLRLPWNRAPSNTDYSQFPPVLEYVTQRIQAYFSVYKYTDDSRTNNTIVVLVPQNLENISIVQGDEEIDIETTTTTDYQTDETTSVSLDDTTMSLNEVI